MKNNTATSITPEADYTNVIRDEVNRNAIIEIMADVEHDRWAKWHRYFISKCEVFFPAKETEEYILLALPKELSERWTRQCDTKYADLSEIEQNSDRHEVIHTLRALAENKVKMYFDRSENAGKQGL